MENIRGVLLIVAGSALILFFVFWINVTSLTTNDYLRICYSSNGTLADFNKCMSPFWDQFQMGRSVMTVSFVVLVVALLSFGSTEIKRRRCR